MFDRLIVGQWKRLITDWDRREQIIDQSAGHLKVDVAGDDQSRVVRQIVLAMKVLDIFDHRIVDILNAADGPALIGRVSMGHEVQFLDGFSIGTVADPQLKLFNHDRALIVKIDLGDRQAGHAVRFQPQRQRKLVGWQRLIIGGYINRGISIYDAPSRRNELAHAAFRQIWRAFKHHVFKQMGESASAFGVIGSADLIPDINRNCWRRNIARQNDLQTVVQNVLLNIQPLA